MMNALDRAWDDLRRTAQGMSNQLVNELNALADSLSTAQVHFNEAMRDASKLRAEADAKQAAAIRAYDTAMTQAASVILALKSQLESGDLHPPEALRIANGAGAQQ